MLTRTSSWVQTQTQSRRMSSTLPQPIQPATTTTLKIAPQQAQSSTARPANSDSPSSEDTGVDGGKKKKTTKRRKTDGRGGSIKREIGHLCHDERRPRPNEKTAATTSTTPTTTTTSAPTTSTTSATQAPVPGPSGAVSYGMPVPLTTQTASNKIGSIASLYGPPTQTYAPSTTTATWPSQPQTQTFYRPDTLGNEFSVLTDFLETLDDSTFFSGAGGGTVTPSLMSTQTPTAGNAFLTNTYGAYDTAKPAAIAQLPSTSTPQHSQPSTTQAAATQQSTQIQKPHTSPISATAILPSATKQEKFLLTAADQEDGSRDERLARVIRAKYEAGLLKPYNYVKGYARLSRWMDRKAVAQSLRDIDLVFIEEAFERLLLDYDRVFSAMGVPACLWRRTGEIYKANREFCELVGVEGGLMREGRLCIYELMAEESAVNYWEKYGHVAFDASQKAVLTSCVLRYKPQLNLGSSTPTPRSTNTPTRPTGGGGGDSAAPANARQSIVSSVSLEFVSGLVQSRILGHVSREGEADHAFRADAGYKRILHLSAFRYQGPMRLSGYITALSLVLTAFSAPTATGADQWLSGHNTIRGQHHAEPLTWNPDLASAAQNWANQCNFTNSGGPYGENLAWGTGSIGIPAVIKLWADSEKSYDPSNPQYSTWTQMVWKSSKELGCAQATCPVGGETTSATATFFVCEYSPPGNVIGQFGDNVEP
ncbi:Transcription factor [Paramarasmius palmivorus]|uniref:Transcription factor n=1 Tax=Paramarasmius palmivorus TaxID=297713 RepID=A0AAW0BPP1_9AGAR